MDKVDYYYDYNVYQSNAKDMSAQLTGAEKGYQKQVVESYKEAIKNQIEIHITNYGLQIDILDISLDEDPESETCGQINSIALVASPKKEEKEKEKSNVTPIDEVTIDKVTINTGTDSKNTKQESKSKEGDKFDTVLELNIKQELVSLYGVPIDQLSVTINQ